MINTEELKYDFVVGKDPKKVVLDSKLITSIFENKSKSCPISEYSVVKDQKGSPLGADAKSFVQLDKTNV